MLLTDLIDVALSPDTQDWRKISKEFVRFIKQADQDRLDWPSDLPRTYVKNISNKTPEEYIEEARSGKGMSQHQFHSLYCRWPAEIVQKGVQGIKKHKTKPAHIDPVLRACIDRSRDEAFMKTLIEASKEVREEVDKVDVLSLSKKRSLNKRLAFVLELLKRRPSKAKKIILRSLKNRESIPPALVDHDGLETRTAFLAYIKHEVK